MFGMDAKAKDLCKAAALLVLAAGIVRPDAAQAQRAQTFDSVTIDQESLPNLGKVIPINSAASFRVDPSTGSITRISGNAVRPGNSSTVSTPTVTITCNRSILSSAVCSKNTVMAVTISSTSSARARISAFAISPVPGAPVTWGATTTSGNQLSFNVTFTDAKNTVASFKLGMTVSIEASGATGAIALPYTVTISRP
jgi:hypothetical protein